ncbi:hypothetical protein [Streptomyces chiangmaiensis]|uniref:hypothetical protein n=1 Tax=Streptomyces chiangmaiensis TaxID=766497 RepID=UPI0036383CDE
MARQKPAGPDSSRSSAASQYALGLEPADAGYDYSVLSEFRDRLVAAAGGREILDAVLAAARRWGLVTVRGGARTDFTHVLSAVCELNRLEPVAETLRSALNAVALAEPGRLNERARPERFKHYATRAVDSRFPKERSRRDQTYRRIGGDAMHLFRMIWAKDSPPGLRRLPEVEVLRRVWVQCFHLVDREVACRGPKDRLPGLMRLVTPYDLDARTGGKRDIDWDGYKVHVTETCEENTPHLVTSVVVTLASVSDDRMTVHAEAPLHHLHRGEAEDRHLDCGLLQHETALWRGWREAARRARTDHPGGASPDRSGRPGCNNQRLYASVPGDWQGDTKTFAG